MDKNLEAEVFGDFSQHDRTCEQLYDLVSVLCRYPPENEWERIYLLAAIRRTLSLSKAFRQAVKSQNGQMASTLVRLNLDTLARTYALYWADETAGMSFETFSKAISDGCSIRNMKLRGSNERATDKWLIEQISPLGDWISEIYKNSSGAIHFSNFHINQLFQQSTVKDRYSDGSLLAEFTIGPGERDADIELYREIMQAFLHITMMFAYAVDQRVNAVVSSISATTVLK